MNMVRHNGKQRNFSIRIINGYLGKTIFCDVANIGQLHRSVSYLSQIMSSPGSAYCNEIDTTIILMPCSSG